MPSRPRGEPALETHQEHRRDDEHPLNSNNEMPDTIFYVGVRLGSRPGQ